MPKDIPVDCSDLLSPTVEFSRYEDKVVRALSEGMKRGRSPEEVMEKLAADPAFAEEVRKYREYSDAIFKRVEAHVREKYNTLIQEERGKGAEDIKRGEDYIAKMREALEKKTDVYSQKRERLATEVQKKGTIYRDSLTNLINEVDSEIESGKLKTYGKRRGPLQLALEYIREAFYKAFPQYRPKGFEELFDFHKDIENLRRQQRK